MRSDEIIDRIRKAADIGSVAAWSDFTAARLMQEATERHISFMSDEEVRAAAGYGVQSEILTTVVGQQLYPVPWRAVAGGFVKLEIQLPGQPRWLPLNRVEVSGSEEFDLGATQTGQPTRYCVQDGFVALFLSPNAAYSLRFTFYMRPNQIVQSQSSTVVAEGSDAADRGRITAKDTINRTVTVNAVPFDQLLAAPAAITSGLQRIDIIRPNGTFALSMWSVTQTLAGLVFTLGGTQSMARVQVGDYVRVEDQSDWPMGLPVEAHRMVANRAAMEVARDVGIEEKVQMLATVTQADLERFRNARSPQVKSAPRVIPLRPMFSR